MSIHFPFLYEKHNKLPKISDGTRFYSADTANSNSTLFIARSQYFDTLIHQLPEGFISIYHTQFFERIYSASVLDTQRWYLVTILRFGDGIEMRPSYRSIFIAASNLKSSSPPISDSPNSAKQKHSTNLLINHEKVFLNSVIYPVSSRTYFPQYVSWTCFNASLFMFTIFDNTIHTLEVAYDKSTVTYKITPRTTTKGYSFRSVISSNVPHVYSIQSGASTSRPPHLSPGNVNNNKMNNNCSSPFLINKTKTDIPIKFKLPDEIMINPNTEFHMLTSPQRRTLSPPLNEDRCVILANLDEISIVFPLSEFFLKIPYKYEIEEYINLSKKYNPNIKINQITKTPRKYTDYVGYTQDEAYLRPASRIPLYYFENNLIIIAAPRGFLTFVLIDQNDRIRASFMVPLFEIKNNQNDPDDNDNTINNDNRDNRNRRRRIADDNYNEKIYNAFSLNDKLSRVLCETTGEIYKMKLNPAFFASKDPRFIIPLLHYFIHPKKGKNFLSDDIITKYCIDISIFRLISEQSLQLFWNGEIFNEILLLLFNTSSMSITFRERVCSTFAKPCFYKQWISLFIEFKKGKEDSNLNNKANTRQNNLLKSPEPESFSKSRSNSMIYEYESNSIDETIKTIPTSPIAHNNKDIEPSGSYGSENSTDAILIDDLETSCAEDNGNFSRAAVSPSHGIRRNSSVYPSSLPKNKLPKKVNVASPHQQLPFRYYEENLRNLISAHLTTIVSTPLISNQTDANFKNSVSNTHPIFNFPDIESKACKMTLESLQLNDIYAFYKLILKIMNESLFFDLSKYSEKIRFAVYMQFTSIRFALSKKPLNKTVKIFEEFFKENPSSSKTSKEFWISPSFLPHDINWPEVGFRMNANITTNPGLFEPKESQDMNKLKRQWWFLRSKKNLMVQKEVSVPEGNLFDFVEQVTNKSESGNEIFQLHQGMFGFGLYQTVEIPSV